MPDKKVKILTQTVTRKTSTIELTREIILDSLGVKTPNARVYITVPSGGDYSGQELSIEGNACVYVTWDEVEVKDEQS